MTPADYVGIRSGYLMVLGRPVPTWEKAFAKCRCGEIVEGRLSDFIRGHTKSCGGKVCRLKENLKGQVFGRLTVTGLASRVEKSRQWKWNVRCACGNHREVYGKALRNGNTKSCGCLRKETLIRKVKEQQRFSDGRFVCLAA